MSPFGAFCANYKSPTCGKGVPQEMGFSSHVQSQQGTSCQAQTVWPTETGVLSETVLGLGPFSPLEGPHTVQLFGGGLLGGLHGNATCTESQPWSDSS